MNNIDYEDDINVEALLRTILPEKDLPKPEIDVYPKQIIIDEAQFSSSNPFITIRNIGRGVLHGTIGASSTINCVEFIPNTFCINRKITDSANIGIKIDTENLEPNEDYNLKIIISSNATFNRKTIPLRIKTSARQKEGKGQLFSKLLSLLLTHKRLFLPVIALFIIVMFIIGFIYLFNNLFNQSDDITTFEADNHKVVITEVKEPLFSEHVEGINEIHTEATTTPYYPPSYLEGKPLSELKIGDRVSDPSWEWEFRFGFNYTDEAYTLYYPKVVKPVIWIVVAFEHYGPDSGVTLLSEELIARFPFDYSCEIKEERTQSTESILHFRESNIGSNHWGLSGIHSNNVDYGLRPWLNSKGLFENEGFYNAFPENFKSGIITLTIPNKDWQYGAEYTVYDNVFIPSATELGGTLLTDVLEVGTVFPYFNSNDRNLRVSSLPNKDAAGYWTRSPLITNSYSLCTIDKIGNYSSWNASYFGLAVRPAINVKSQTLVSELPNNDGIYEIVWIR